MLTRSQRNLCLCGLFLAAAAFPATSMAERPVPGGVQLLPGYEHTPLQGFDSIVGAIEKKGRVKITYEIGRVTQPGQPAMGGDFSDRALSWSRSKDQVKWYKEQVVNGQPVHIAYMKDNVLCVTFPKGGINFSAKAETAEDVAEVLLMLLTYPLAQPQPEK